MRAICPKDRNHNKFIVTAHITQDWKVDEYGIYLETVDDCVEVTHTPTVDDVWSCSVCGATAITVGEIQELYATVLEGQEDSYADIYSTKDEAIAQIGEYIDGLKVISIKKGYSLSPKGTNILYDDAPDFCESKSEIINIAKELNITL